MLRMLTNRQRKCFALNPICENWQCIEAKAGPYDNYKTYLYLDGHTIVKCIMLGESIYSEYELSEEVSEDRKYLLPKTEKGKPVILSAATVSKRKGVGMRLNYSDKNINLYNEKTECTYFFNANIKSNVCDRDSFFEWVEQWCEETTEEDLADIYAFSKQERRHIRYKEGDVFRFKFGRRLYGYGRILLDYGRMRKKKEPFWDILMTKPLVCSVYHIVTERADVSVDELKGLKSLPSDIISDNVLYYGEYEIIGNIPITDNEDYPIMYGNSFRLGEKAVYYQCGKVFRKIENGSQLYKGFENGVVGFFLGVNIEVLQKCINANSNAPYWEQHGFYSVNSDLRNPIFADKLAEIKKQFNL